MNTKFFIGFATLSEFLSHKPRVVYYSLSSKTHTSNKSNFILTTWECELMLQYFPFVGDEDQRVHYCLMRLGSALDQISEAKERVRRRALTARDAIKAILHQRGSEIIEAQIAMPTDLEKLNADFDLLKYDKNTDSFSPILNTENAK